MAVATVDEHGVDVSKLNRTQLARWENAKRWMRKVNELLADGCLVLIGDDRVEYPLVVHESHIFQPWHSTGGSGQSRFSCDPEEDGGLYTSIKEFNKSNAILAYRPVAEKISW